MKLVTSILTLLVGGVLSFPFPSDDKMPPGLPIPGYELPDDDPYNPGLPLDLPMMPSQHVPEGNSYGQGKPLEPPAMPAQHPPAQHSQQHASSEPQQKPKCRPGERFEFWCDEKIPQHRYSQTCKYDSVSKEYRFVPDRSTCPQEDTKQYFQPNQGEYHVLQPEDPPQEYQVLHPQAPPQEYQVLHPQAPPPHEYQKSPHGPPQHRYKEPQYMQPETSYQHHYPDPHRPRPVQGGRYPNKPGRYPPRRRRPRGPMSNMFQTLLKLYAMQKFVNKDGADDSKFKDMLKYFMMFQNPGMHGGNNQQLWSILYGLPGLEGTSSLDLGDIFKSFSGNPFGDMDMGGLMGNPMLAGLMGGDGSPFASMFGSGDDSPLKDMMSYFPLMGGLGSGDGMKDILGDMSPFALMGLGQGKGGYPGSPLLNMILSSMNKGG